MTVKSIGARISRLAGIRLVGIVGLAFGAIAAVPAHANSSAATADITAPLRSAQPARAATGGDDEFRRLFASWKSLDTGVAGIAATTGTIGTTVQSGAFNPARVSIPSLIPVNSPTFTSGFGMRWHPVLGGRHAHKGIDLASAWGTPVHAPADGVVGHAEWFSSYGLYIALEHGGTIETRYGHLSRINVASGQLVHKGDVIGFVGSTGRSTGPHLHYEIRINDEPVDPLQYLLTSSTK